MSRCAKLSKKEALVIHSGVKNQSVLDIVGPNFLGIGAPKCGTTWLSEVLRKHLDVPSYLGDIAQDGERAKK